ncbi:MAG: putative manganese-dependent inorganic diphosphatase [Methanomicrobiales archaeon]|nr:putative manganese-dependent inorganic diphosphatase [Methanomicrobiales archaeon]
MKGKGTMETVLVLGHRQPDTDSIGSVLGYAAFLNQAELGRYLPARCGDLTQETTFALETFGLDPPVLVDSLVPRVADLPISRISVTQDVPVAEIAALMEAHDIRNVPVTDGQGRLVGMAGEHALARSYVRRTRNGERTLATLPLDTFARNLSARILVRGAETIGGRVSIALDSPEKARGRPAHRDIAVVGDNEAVQQALVSAGMKALILAGGAEAGGGVTGAAQLRGVSLLATDLDVFGIVARIDLALPAGMVMETDIPRLQLTDTLDQAKRVVYSSKFRAACVVEKDGTLRGVVTRTTLLPGVRRKVILLDHNEFSQAAEGIEEAEILEIIDHHRLGAMSTLKPVKFLNDPVGSTSTIIAMKFREAGTPPGPAIAGILLSGVLSDTLNLKMSTTTDHDRRAIEYLAPLAGVDPQSYGRQLLERGMDLAGATMDDLLTRDTKQYELFGREVIIAQVMVPSTDFTQAHAAGIRDALGRLRARRGVDLYLGMFTSGAENASELFAAGEARLLGDLGLGDQPVRLDGMMSRKKDLVPWVGEKLRAG